MNVAHDMSEVVRLVQQWRVTDEGVQGMVEAMQMQTRLREAIDVRRRLWGDVKSQTSAWSSLGMQLPPALVHNACEAVCGMVALHCDVAVGRLQLHRQASEGEDKDKSNATAANRRAAEVQNLLAASLSLACDVVAFIGRDAHCMVEFVREATVAHLETLGDRYHAYLSRQDWHVVTQAFEDGLKVVRQLKTVVDGTGHKAGAMSEALRQVLVELTALLLVHVVRKCEGNPNARAATSMLLYGCKWVRALQSSVGDLQDDKVNVLVGQLEKVEEQLSAK